MCMSSTMAKCLFKVLVSCYVCVPEGDQSSSVLCISKKLYPPLASYSNMYWEITSLATPTATAPIWLWAVLYLFAHLLESSRKFLGPIPTFQLCRGGDKFLWWETQCTVRAQAIDAPWLRNSCTHFVAKTRMHCCQDFNFEFVVEYPISPGDRRVFPGIYYPWCFVSTWSSRYVI